MDILTVVLTAAAAAATGVLAVAGTGLKQLIAAWFKVREKRILKESYSKGLQYMADFSDTLKQLLRIENVDVVLVYVGQNGGGLPKAGHPYTVRSHIGWSKKKGEDVVRTQDFDLLIDSTYATTLMKMVSDGSVVSTAKDYPDGTILQSLYKDESVNQALLYFLNCDNSQMVYLSVATCAQEFKPEQKVRVEMLVHRLRGIMAHA